MSSAPGSTPIASATAALVRMLAGTGVRLADGTLAGSTSESQTPAHFEVGSNGQTSVKAGQTVRLSMPPAALHFFDEQGARLQDLTS